MRIISGGQSGADRGGLEIAHAMGIETGGTAPLGYRTEYGPCLALRDVFGLVESPSPHYPARTLANVRDADLTVIFGTVHPTGGSQETINFCQVISCPYIVNPTPEQLRSALLSFGVEILNVAGNRHSKNKFAFHMAVDCLRVALVDYATKTWFASPGNPHVDR